MSPFRKKIKHFILGEFCKRTQCPSIETLALLLFIHLVHRSKSDARQEEAQGDVSQEVAKEGAQADTTNVKGQREEGFTDTQSEHQDTDTHSSHWKVNGNRIKCQICGYTRNNKNQMDKHMSERHGKDEENSSYNCRDCSFQTIKRDHLVNHLKETHDIFLQQM